MLSEFFIIVILTFYIRSIFTSIYSNPVFGSLSFPIQAGSLAGFVRFYHSADNSLRATSLNFD
jgi:hypothetical protein